MPIERISYDEARRWFWIRTWVWSIPSWIASSSAAFIYTADTLRAVDTRLWVGLSAGALSVLFGILGASVSLGLPWMRRGSKWAFLVNGFACAAVAALGAFILSGLVYSFVSDHPEFPYPRRVIDTAIRMSEFGIPVSAMWGFLFGSWFAMRRDKYFVELI